MGERPRFFDDLAGVAGGAFSALAGMREELESSIRARVDEAIRRLDLVKREDLEAVQEMAAGTRAALEQAEARIVALEGKVAAMAIPLGDAVGRTHPVEGTEAPPGSVPPVMAAGGSPIDPLVG